MQCLPAGGVYLATFWTSDVDPKLSCGMGALKGPAEPVAVAAKKNIPHIALKEAAFIDFPILMSSHFSLGVPLRLRKNYCC
jgi:hypothetical protein